MFKLDKNAVLDLAMLIGLGCLNLHNLTLVHGVSSTLIIEGDETWSFIFKKQSRIDPAKDPAEYGDAYTFIALDATAKLVISYHVGKRTEEDADAFARDLRSRLTMVPHLATDGFPAYPAVIAKHFQGAIDYGTAVKHYRTGSQRGPDHRYEPPRDPFVTKHSVLGAPQDDLICTAHVERYNLTQRHIVGRTRRLCLAFSKTLKGHVAGTALGVFAYNFCREHSALGKRRTPAMVLRAWRIHPWTIYELVAAALEAAELPRRHACACPPRDAGVSGRQARRCVAPLAGRRLPAVGACGVSPGEGCAARASPSRRAVSSGTRRRRGRQGSRLAAVASRRHVEPVDDRQLDLLAWRPKPLPPKGSQLELFDP